jgi:hypothetical protein
MGSPSYVEKQSDERKPPLGAAAQQPQADQNASASNDLWSCPQCGGPMVVVERFTAAEMQLRSPPLVTAAA